MTKTMTVAETIYQQLGGGRFTAMTGAKNFVALENGLRFRIGRNASKANMVEIKLNGLDLYDIEFIKHTPYSFKISRDGQSFKETPESFKTVAQFEDYYGDMLQGCFERVTGMYTSL